MAGFWQKPFATEYYELITRLSPSECERHLLAQLTTGLGRPNFAMASITTGGQSHSHPGSSSVWGIVTEGTFTLHRSLRHHDAFKTVATGTLEPYRGGTRLTVNLQPSPFGVLALAVVPLFLLCWSALFLIFFLNPSMQQMLGTIGVLAASVLGTVVLLIWFAIIYILWRWLAAGQDQFLLKFLRNILDAEELTQSGTD